MLLLSYDIVHTNASKLKFLKVRHVVSRRQGLPKTLHTRKLFSFP